MSWRHHDMTLKVTSWLPSPFAFQVKQMIQTRSWCRFYHIRGWETQKWWTYLRRTHAWPGKWLTSRFPWPVIFFLLYMTRYRYWCRFYHIRDWETQKWWTYLRRTHAWPRKWLWRHDFRDLSYFFYYTWHVIDIGVDFTIFETEKLKNDKRIYVELTRDLESDCDVTISVTFRIFSTTHDTLSILVSILPYSRLRNSKMINVFT